MATTQYEQNQVINEIDCRNCFTTFSLAFYEADPAVCCSFSQKRRLQ